MEFVDCLKYLGRCFHSTDPRILIPVRVDVGLNGLQAPKQEGQIIS